MDNFLSQTKYFYSLQHLKYIILVLLITQKHFIIEETEYQNKRKTIHINQRRKKIL